MLASAVADRADISRAEAKRVGSPCGPRWRGPLEASRIPVADVNDHLRTEAGTGEHRVYVIPGADDDEPLPLTAQRHYLGIDAASWFVNRSSSWFKDLMVAGTLSISLASGEESYEIGLGLYELREGARIAPVFDRPVLPERAFRGGTITVKVVVSGVTRDTRIAGLLESTAVASLGVVGGLVQTASTAGVYAPLAQAGSALVGGVRDLLVTEDRRLRLFDPSGLELTMRADQILAREQFLLFHRGARLDRAKLSVTDGRDFAAPRYDGEPLEDGVWLLLRLRRADEFPMERPWFEPWRHWITKLGGLVDDARNTAVPSDTALRVLSTMAGPGEAATMYDAYRNLRDQILNDGTLTQFEASGYAGTLSAYLNSAVAAMRDKRFDSFFLDIARLSAGMRSGEAPDPAAEQTFRREYAAAAAVRPALLRVDLPRAELEREAAADRGLFSELVHLGRLRRVLEDADFDAG